MLDMKKGESVDLNKAANKVLTKLRVGLGWDVAPGKSIDLDAWLIAKGQAPLYFNNKSIAGATLSGDDRTGAGSKDGADENIMIDVAGLTADEYVVVVNIYDAVSKGQFFRDVQRAFVEIEDADTKIIIAKFNMTEQGGDNFSLVAGKLTRTNGELTFSSIGEFSTKDAVTLVKEHGGNA